MENEDVGFEKLEQKLGIENVSDLHWYIYAIHRSCSVFLIVFRDIAAIVLLSSCCKSAMINLLWFLLIRI